MKEIILNVDGMHCEGCETRIKNIVSEIEEVEKVVTDHNSGIVKVTLKEDIDRNVIVEAIEDIGFVVKED